MPDPQQIARRWLFCGVLSPAAYATSDVLAGVLWQGYSFRDQTLSELNAIGSPTRTLTMLFGIAVYAFMTAFGIGVFRVSASRRSLRVLASTVIAFGVTSLTMGPFSSMQLRGSEQGASGTLHLAVVGVGVLLIAIAMVAGATAWRGGFRVYTVVTLLVLLGFGAWGGADAARIEQGLPTPWVGVKERICVYSYQLWFAALAFKLLRAQRGIAAHEP